MSKFKHSKPCKECPFRRNSIPGWLGDSTPEQFINSTEAGVQMPCHCAVDYEKKDWEDQLGEAPLCAGSLVYLKNSCKLPFPYPYLPQAVQDGIPEVLRGLDEVTADYEGVFTHKAEFIQHHTSGLSKWREKFDKGK